MAIDVKVIKVKRSESRHGKPMWILNTAGGDSIYVFDNMLAGRPWNNSSYVKWFDEMENQQEDRWQSSPNLATASEQGKYLTIISLQAPPPDAKPDRTPELEICGKCMARAGGARYIRSAPKTPSSSIPRPPG